MHATMVSPVFVGRQEELAALAEAVAEARTGTPRFALVGGEAGVGKTRLVEEAARAASRSGIRVLTGHCVELGPEGLPFAPVAEALRTLTRSASPEELDAWLGPARGPLSPLLPLERGRETDGVGAAQFPELVLGLIERLAADRPLMLVLEDLHWADRSTLGLVAYLVRAVRDVPVVLAGTYRSDEVHRTHPLRPLLSGWERMRQVRRLELGRFRREEVAVLVEAILGRPAETGVVDLVLDRSEGNAFLVEEMVGVVLDGGAMSPSLRDLLLVRVEARSPEARRLLRAVSVAGRQVRERLLAAVADLERPALFEALRELVDSHLLVVDAHGQGYEFRHALARDAVYHDMLPGERAAWHTAYARALSADPGLAADPSGVPAALAHHWFAALDLPAALPALLAAAEASAYAPAEQLTHLERALEVWPRVPDAAALTGTDLIEVLASAADAALRAGSMERSSCLLEQALTELGEHGSAPRRALLMERRSRALCELGRPEEGIALLRSALALLPPEPPGYAHAVLLTSLARAHLSEAESGHAAEFAERAVAVAAAVDAHVEHAESLITLGCAQAALGDTEPGMRTMDEGRRLAERIGAVEITMRAWNNHSDLLETLGLHEEAMDSAGAGLELARRTGHIRHVGMYLAGNLVEPMVRLGRWDEAAQTIAQALRCEPEGLFAATLLEQSAQLAVLSGRHEEATRIAGRALNLAIGSRDQQFLQPLAFTLAEARRLTGDLDGALATVMDALATGNALCLGRYSWPLAWLGTRVAADRALLARDRRSPEPTPADPLAAVTATLPIVTTPARGYALLTKAERTRLTATPAPGRRPAVTAWQAAATAWRGAGEPYLLAYCLFRLAETLCAAGDRRTAAEAAREASELATGLGAAPLAADIGALTRRARLSLTPDPPVAEPPPEDPLEPFALTDREREVIVLLADGRSNAQIATSLFISPKTVSVHVSNILAKLGVTGRVEAAAMLHRLSGHHL
ncbi:LuxR family transcriptional regulator [Sphaerisporangium rubeum]|uniref:DNA-binding CsgD family transcriptional regulator/tetratricopeptide (TPR) repeat protein n=1 Tax=Sphaerisporangium rubeum TaxID=321317 RepID=A0A7X0II45_9ACTN|nr:AAA family ATPase [Sphaerisporangium rubeum]MBB6474418.1 DNA-binding CsgD family transcriptional regulator/tetratricopeptide (TPR) repeat protein [Sphaerisporangium rubeum]